MVQDPDFAAFRRTVQDLTGIDLGAYKEMQLRRRLDGLLRRTGVVSLRDYAQLLRDSAERLQQFKDFVTINVSSFFRDTERFRDLETVILPALLAQWPSLTVWSAGCSTGAEPYSLAMILADLAPRGHHRILATDIDATVLATARKGEYSEKDVAGVTPERLERYFEHAEDTWRVNDRIRRVVEFRQHNLLSDPYPERAHLVLCRNVVIYFTDEAKDGVYRNLVRVLPPGGVLFVGGTEIVLKSRELGLDSISPFFYRRRGGDGPASEQR